MVCGAFELVWRQKDFSARNNSVFIAACCAVNAAHAFQETGHRTGFLHPPISPATERGFFVLGTYDWLFAWRG